MVALEGPRVRLRPLAVEEFDLVWRVSREGVDGFAPEPERSPEVVRDRIRSSGRLVDGRLDLAIEADGRLVGEIDARRPNDPLPEGVYEIGIALFRSADRGRGYGREALTLLLGHLFDDRGAGRVQASTDIGNDAMRGVLESLGFVLEGVMRGFMPVGDERRDFALYAMTKSDYDEARKLWT